MLSVNRKLILIFALFIIPLSHFMLGEEGVSSAAKGVDSTCSSMAIGHKTRVYLAGQSDDATVCMQDAYADPNFLASMYGVSGEAYSELHEGSIAVYIVAGGEIVERFKLNGHYYLKKPMASACGRMAGLLIEKSDKACFLGFN